MDALTPTLQMRRKLTQEIEGQRNQVAVTVSQGREEAGCKQRPLTFLSHTGNCVLNDCMTTWGVLSPNAQKRPFLAGQAEPTRLPFSTCRVNAAALSWAVSCLVRPIQGPLDSQNGRV